MPAANTLFTLLSVDAVQPAFSFGRPISREPSVGGNPVKRILAVLITALLLPTVPSSAQQGACTSYRQLRDGGVVCQDRAPSGQQNNNGRDRDQSRDRDRDRDRNRDRDRERDRERARQEQREQRREEQRREQRRLEREQARQERYERQRRAERAQRYERYEDDYGEYRRRPSRDRDWDEPSYDDYYDDY